MASEEKIDGHVKGYLLSNGNYMIETEAQLVELVPGAAIQLATHILTCYGLKVIGKREEME